MQAKLDNHMIKDVLENKLDYSILALISGTYLVMAYRFQTDYSYLFDLTLGFALGYFLWGIYHHLRNHTLHIRIVLEYFLVSALGLVIISTLFV